MTEISKSRVFAVKNSPIMAELQQQELERQLSLFQLFRKLYEHHSDLLEEIFQLENIKQRSLRGVGNYYIQGVVDASAVYLMTNLSEKKSQRLQQPQGIWTIGSDSNSGIQIAEAYLSERHGAIQYVEGQGFYLIDFNSTNGSFVNGEPVYQPTLIKDGDRLRLGGITFNFFENSTCCTLPTVAVELLMQLVPRLDSDSATLVNIHQDISNQLTPIQNEVIEVHRESSLIADLEPERLDSFTAEEKSEILDRLFRQQATDNCR
ncbi:FHA domain-containing protein [Fortiea contorta]|uniref:FHA domain-containing protein n=1 Tax=Fortiea contorta TaxID=1892405 RepID=UPI000347BCDC|nr:FHA domain-containing protein [Fortiea contorta]